MNKLNKVNFLFLNFYDNEKIINIILLYLNNLSLNNELNISILHKDKNSNKIFEKLLFKNNFKKLIIKSNFVINDDIKNITQKLTDYLTENRINVVNMFNGYLTVYDIDERIVILDNIFKKEKIRFYWISMSFLRGKFNISEDIYFKNDEILNQYKHLVNNPTSINKIPLEEYITGYWNFKRNVQNVDVTVTSKIKLHNLMNLRFILQKFFNKFNLLKISIYKQYKKQYILNKFDKNKITGSYILFLGTKNNHWFNKYANKGFINPSNYIDHIIKSVPKTHSLIIKPHPRDESLVLKIPLNKKNIFYTGDLEEVAKSADLIITTGSASGFELLTLNKKVIHLGSKSYLGNINEDLLPICVVDDVTRLREKIKKVISAPVAYNKIKAYLSALLKYSYSFDDKKYSLTRENQLLEKAANEILEKIRRNVIK